MSWEISHTAEAWDQFYLKLCDQPKEWLVAAAAIDAANKQDELDHQFSTACFDCEIDDNNIDAIPDWQINHDKAKRKLEQLSLQELIDICYAATERHRTCSNGGHTFYIDESGFYGITLT